jgi:hypothetical protein
MSVIINILAVIGFLVVLSWLVYYLYAAVKKRSDYVFIANTNPPESYMQNSGIKCPDYWVNTGVDANGNYICKNSFNIDSVAGTNCNSSEMHFTPIQSGYTWESYNPNGLTTLSDKEKYDFLSKSVVSGSTTRCNWINNCGPATTTQGIWTGVNEICNSPPPAS